MRPLLRRAGIVVAVLAAATAVFETRRTSGAAPTPFAAEIERLSERGGAFDTDNLITNERGYLDVIPKLVAGGVSGGAYVGVGPDQNFSYIARVRPTVAYIIDVRRDNLLLHLLFKALFARAETRAAYLSLLTGRDPPGDADRWKNATLNDIVAYIDQAKPAGDPNSRVRQSLRETIRTFGVALEPTDYETIERFHRAFIEAGLGLQFHTFNRPPQPYYPTLRQLLLATDRSRRMWNYLASEADFQFLRSMQARNAIVPVVGDVAGSHAMRAIGAAIASRRLQVSALYISNVENYLFRDRVFDEYTENLTRLPRGPKSVIIRSIFLGGGQSASFVQSFDEMVENATSGKYDFYTDIVKEWHRN
jgi:hypothetical protein